MTHAAGVFDVLEFVALDVLSSEVCRNSLEKRHSDFCPPIDANQRELKISGSSIMSSVFSVRPCFKKCKYQKQDYGTMHLEPVSKPGL